MPGLMLLCAIMLGPPAPDDPATTTDRAAYESVRSRTGRNPDAHVALALWCESQGMTAERLKHLAIAILRDPGHEAARGLLGYIRQGDRWRRVEDVELRGKDDQRLAELLTEYQGKRSRSRATADDQWKLALWCEANGLEVESRAHLTVVTRLDPSRSSAWRRLGLELHRGRWQSPSQARADEAEREAQERASVRWLEILGGCSKELKAKGTRGRAEAKLAEVTDPRAVPAIWRVFVKDSPEDQARAVQLLGQVDAPASTRALALIGVFSPSVGSRRAAMESLARRDPRDAAGLLLGLLRDPEMSRSDLDAFAFRVTLRPIGVDALGSPGVLAVETRWFASVRVYTVDEGFGRGDLSGGAFNPMGTYENRVMVQRLRQWNDLNAIVAPLKAEADRAWLSFESRARPVRTLNSRVFQALRLLTSLDIGEDREAWRRWWTEEQGFAYEPPKAAPPAESTDLEPKPVDYSWSHYSCFGKGTPVRTRDGLRPIESLRVGDQILTQDTTTGALSYQPIISVAHNPPAETLRIRTEDDVVVTTGIHRFWKAGRGWVMARDLLRGDAIRTGEGPALIHAIERGPAQPVYNLEVLENQSFFVGKRAILVHDKSAVDPVARPFDRAPSLAVARD